MEGGAMVVFLFVAAGIVLLALAGINLTGRYFAPQWWGLACLAVAFFADVLARAGR